MASRGIGTIENFAKIASSMKVSELENDELSLLRSGLSENMEVASSFDNPLLAALHICRLSAKKNSKGANRDIEKLVVSMNAKMIAGGPDATVKEAVESRKQLKLGGSELAASRLSKTLVKLDLEISEKMEKLKEFQKEKEKQVKKSSPEMARAHAEQVAELFEEKSRRILAIEVESGGDKKVMKAMAEELSEQFTTMIGYMKELIATQAKLLKKGEKPKKAKEISLDESYLPKKASPESVRDTKNLLANGYKVEEVPSFLSVEFVHLYSLFVRSFPPDELDPPSAYSEMMGGKGEVDKNPIKGGTLLSNGNRIYSKYLVACTKDASGKVIGGFDGSVLGNEKVFGLYGAHIVMGEEDRRNGLATMLQTSVITECSKYAGAAEKMLTKALKQEVSYGPEGKKAVYGIGEIEFPSLRPSEIADTWGRLIYHGKNELNIVAPLSLRYAQSDILYEEGGTWTPVPLLFGVKCVNGEATGEGTLEMLRLMYASFIIGEMDKEGVMSDWNYATRFLGSKEEIGNIAIMRLPTDSDGLVEIMTKGIGTESIPGSAENIMRDHYRDHAYTKEYLKSPEKGLGVKEAQRFFDAGNGRAPRGI